MQQLLLRRQKRFLDSRALIPSPITITSMAMLQLQVMTTRQQRSVTLTVESDTPTPAPTPAPEEPSNPASPVKEKKTKKKKAQLPNTGEELLVMPLMGYGWSCFDSRRSYEAVSTKTESSSR